MVAHVIVTVIMKIKALDSCTALPGGTIRIEVEGLENPSKVQVEVGGVSAEILAASTKALSIRIPDRCENDLVVRNGHEENMRLQVGRLVTSELHSVGNPVVDSMGNVYVTYSGTRGEKVPFSVFVVHSDGSKHPFLAEVINPTGLAIGRDEHLYISSRYNGDIYRSTFDKQVEKYIDGLGLASGLVFDSQDNLLVGDRGGTIYRADPNRNISVFCELEPSVSAYHLAIGPDDTLFVTGPTLATQDCIYKVSPKGQVGVLFKGLGRPQGLGFDPQGNLQVVASYQGKKGLYTFKHGEPKLSVSGPMLVGLAYNPEGKVLYLVDSTNLFRLEWTDDSCSKSIG